ncbi:Choline trimethylamine-lyase [subsurface metagenome]
MDRGFDRFFGFLEGACNYFTGNGHFILDREKFDVPDDFYTTSYIMNYSLEFIEEAKEALSKVDFRDKDAVNRSLFLKAVIICYKSVIDFIRRYEKLAQELDLKEKNLDRKEELEKISNCCNWIAENPPRTFFEALQMTWFVHLLRWIESNGHSVTIGRLDQFLYPYYEKDTKEASSTTLSSRVLPFQYLIISFNSIFTPSLTTNLSKGLFSNSFNSLSIKVTPNSGYIGTALGLLAKLPTRSSLGWI